MTPSRQLSHALAGLWQLRPPRPRNLLLEPAFVHLRETCQNLYPAAGDKTELNYALDNALCSLGLPCGLAAEDHDLILPVKTAANELNNAFRKTQSTRVHLCPLDCVDDIPTLTFGSNRILKLSVSELNELVDLPRLKRTNAKWHFDGTDFSQFTWLMVRETIPISANAGERAVPFLYQIWEGDVGAIEPHEKTFPEAVERALAFLMLAPWEDWTDSPNVEWRCFRIPWIHTVDDDIFGRSGFPPSSNTLSWRPDFAIDRYGNEIDLGYKPERWDLAKQASQELENWVNITSWSEFMHAQASPLFASPVLHFLLRGYRSTGIDEFLAHITVIDAALGLHIDHNGKKRPKFPNANRDPGATLRAAARLSSLLDDDKASVDYQSLYTTRSEFVHGRKMGAISGKDRFLARNLARRTAFALINVAKADRVTSRESYLNELLEAGLKR